MIEYFALKLSPIPIFPTGNKVAQWWRSLLAIIRGGWEDGWQRKTRRWSQVTRSLLNLKRRSAADQRRRSSQRLASMTYSGVFCCEIALFRVRRRLITSGRRRRRSLIRTADVISQIDRRQEFFPPLNPPRIHRHATWISSVRSLTPLRGLYSFALYYCPPHSSTPIDRALAVLSCASPSRIDETILIFTWLWWNIVFLSATTSYCYNIVFMSQSLLH